MRVPVDDGQGAATGLAPGADLPADPCAVADPAGSGAEPGAGPGRGARFLAQVFALLAAGAREVGAFLATGALCVLAGGIVAALARPLNAPIAAWAAAYLVLVGGVAQIMLGGIQYAIVVRRPSRRLLLGEYLTFNGANVLVLLGGLLAVPAIVDVGGAVLVVSLVLFLVAARGARDGGWAVRLYDLVLAIVLASIPVGLLLTHLRG